MVLIILLAVLMAVFFIYIVYSTSKPGSSNGVFEKKQHFLTPNETHFYHLLYQACADEYVICPQVSLGALMDVSSSVPGNLYWKIKNKFAMKILDFVLCTKKDMKPVLIVELDDKTHKAEKDFERHGLTGHTGLKTIRFWSRNKPDVLDLKAHIAKAINN